MLLYRNEDAWTRKSQMRKDSGDKWNVQNTPSFRKLLLNMYYFMTSSYSSSLVITYAIPPPSGISGNVLTEHRVLQIQKLKSNFKCMKPIQYMSHVITKVYGSVVLRWCLEAFQDLLQNKSSLSKEFKCNPFIIKTSKVRKQTGIKSLKNMSWCELYLVKYQKYYT